MKKLGKIKVKKLKVITTYQWFDIIIVSNISPDVDQKHKILTDKSVLCVFLDGYYYGLDLFVANNKKEFKRWDLIGYFQDDFGVVLKINSIRSKYQIGVFYKS